MTFTWDFNTATLLAIAGQIVLLVWFLARTANTAKAALAAAEAANRHATDAHDKIAALHGLLSLHREQVAREYVDKEFLREIETRLSTALDRLSDRIDEALNRPKHER